MLASRASERKARAIRNTVQYSTVQYCTSYPFLALGLGPLGTPHADQFDDASSLLATHARKAHYCSLCVDFRANEREPVDLDLPYRGLILCVSNITATGQVRSTLSSFHHPASLSPENAEIFIMLKTIKQCHHSTSLCSTGLMLYAA
jgi:hypothetical protein